MPKYNNEKLDYFEDIFSKLTTKEIEFLTQYRKEADIHSNLVVELFFIYTSELKELLEPRGCECPKKCKETWCNNPFIALYERLNKREEGYNEIVGYLNIIKERKHGELGGKVNSLEKERNEWKIKFNNKNRESEDYKEKYEKVQKELDRLKDEKIRDEKKNVDDKLKQERKNFNTQDENTRLRERLESSNARVIDLSRRLENKEEEVNVVRKEKENQATMFENKLDQKSALLEEARQSLKVIRN